MKSMLVIAALMPSLAIATTPVPDVPVLSILLTPERIDAAQGRGEVRVLIEVPQAHGAPGKPLFDLPDASDLRVWDAHGNVAVRPLTEPGTKQSDVAGPGMRPQHEIERAYVADRAVEGTLRISYRVAIQNAIGNGGTTPIFPRVDGDGFSALGMTFLAIPRTTKRYRAAIRWNLSAIGPDATGVSSYGDGDVTGPAGPVEQLGNVVVMAGRLQREPRTPDTGKFAAVWSGDPGYDLRPTMQWAKTLHGWMVNFFHTPDDPAYRVFARENGGLNAGGGVAFPNSFFQTWGTGVTALSMRGILAHEMVHTFTANGLGRWYVEGDAVYYQVQLPWRAGMVSTEQYLRDINLTAYRYYTNLRIHAHEDEIDPAFFRDSWLNTLAYDRGALYFAQLNGMIRHKSGGRRSIDDLVRIMVRKGRNGEAISDDTWFDIIRTGIGEDAVALTRSMLAGGLVLPASDAYGPCFRRVAARMRRYELGFTVERKPAGTPVEVRNLVAGSEAARAGIRAGDLVALPLITSEGPRRDPDATITARITRDGQTFPLTWSPRGDAVDGYQWERIPGVPDSLCRPGRDRG